MSLAHIFHLCLMITITFASTCKTVNLNDYLVGYRIGSGVFKTLHPIGIVGCQRECVMVTKCQSIGYNKVTLECSLGQYADNKTLTGVTTDIFIQPNVTDELFGNIGQCINRPCASYERCVKLSSGISACIQNFRPIDLTILLDGSRSITSSEFYSLFGIITHLINSLIDMRLAVATFNVNTDIFFYLDQFLSKSDMISALNDHVIYPDKTGNELGQALLDVESGIYNQSRGDREEAVDVILVLLSPNDMVTGNLKTNADYVKSAGVYVIMVGIGTSEVGLVTMQDVASEPIENYMFRVNTTEYMYVLYGNITDTIDALT